MNKRMLVFVIALLFLCSSAALALDPMGPPTAGLKQGQGSAGVEYMFSSMDLELKNLKFTEVDTEDGTVVFSETEKFKSTTLKDVESNKVYARFGYGICDKWEVFGRLGGADAKGKFETRTISDVGTDEGTPFEATPEEIAAYSHGEFEVDTSMAFAWGFGTKVTFYECDNLSLGALFQFSQTDNEYKLEGSDITASDMLDSIYTTKGKLSITEIQIAVGPTYKPCPTISIYGGPFWHIVDGDWEQKDNSTGFDSTGAVDETGDEKTSGDIEEKSNFGGYIGAQFDINESVAANIEGQFTGDAQAFAANLIWKF